jgi:hypothetical protein
MKCHLCGEELVCGNVELWNVAPRVCVEYACRNKLCRPPSSINTDSSVHMNVVKPDYEINYYLVRFPMNDIWYQATSIMIQCHPGETVFTTKKGVEDSGRWKELVTVPRFIPLDWDKPLDVQVAALKEKLKTLILFL